MEMVTYSEPVGSFCKGNNKPKVGKCAIMLQTFLKESFPFTFLVCMNVKSPPWLRKWLFCDTGVEDINWWLKQSNCLMFFVVKIIWIEKNCWLISSWKHRFHGWCSSSQSSVSARRGSVNLEGKIPLIVFEGDTWICAKYVCDFCRCNGNVSKAHDGCEVMTVQQPVSVVLKWLVNSKIGWWRED